MILNQDDIEVLYRNRHACPNVRKAVRLLYGLMKAVNAQSDGWAYWSAPSAAATPLMELLQTLGNLWYDTDRTITDAQLKKVVTPIKAMVTKQKKIQAKFGNLFEFDVEQAMKSG